MVKFAYNQSKYLSNKFIFFKLNYSFQLRMSYENMLDLFLRLSRAGVKIKKSQDFLSLGKTNLKKA